MRSVHLIRRNFQNSLTANDKNTNNIQGQKPIGEKRWRKLRQEASEPKRQRIQRAKQKKNTLPEQKT